MIYFDMDGVLAKWNTEASVEDTFKEGYFREREPDRKMIELLLRLGKEGREVAVLSNVYSNGYADIEKDEWLDRNGMKRIRRHFIPMVESKHLGHKGVLIDDFTKNLEEWENASGTAIKYFNGINGTKHIWSGFYICHKMTVEEMAEIVKEVDDFYRNRRNDFQMFCRKFDRRL